MLSIILRKMRSHWHDYYYGVAHVDTLNINKHGSLEANKVMLLRERHGALMIGHKSHVFVQPFGVDVITVDFFEIFLLAGDVTLCFFDEPLEWMIRNVNGIFSSIVSDLSSSVDVG